jgi:hypothetical protein
MDMAPPVSAVPRIVWYRVPFQWWTVSVSVIPDLGLRVATGQRIALPLYGGHEEISEIDY